MDRRNFITQSIAATVGIIVIPTVSGCGAVTDLNAILKAAQNFLSVADPNASWLPDFKAAVNTLVTADLDWTADSSTSTKVVDALNALEAVTSVIPLTAVYSPLIDVLVAGIEIVLATFGSSTAQVAQAKISSSRNVRIGRVTIPRHAFRSFASDFKLSWNAAAINAGLRPAVIN
jgi:hypothetical protein